MEKITDTDANNLADIRAQETEDLLKFLEDTKQGKYGPVDQSAFPYIRMQEAEQVYDPLEEQVLSPCNLLVDSPAYWDAMRRAMKTGVISIFFEEDDAPPGVRFSAETPPEHNFYS